VPVRVWRALFIAYAAVTAVHIGWVMLHEPFYFDAWNVAITSGAKPITPGRFFEFWWHEYTHSNPRLGQPLTYLSYKLQYFAVVAMPLAFIAIGAAVTALGTARLPSLRRTRDLALWTFATGALWFALPQIGKTMFCVAYGANYVYTAAIQLWFLVPLRLTPSGTASPGRCAAYALAGVAAGLCNEHTGPTLCAFLVLYAWWLQRRTGERPHLVLAGAAGAIVGFAALFFAPGQGERYEGLAQKAGMWGRVVQHGIEGNLDILRNVVVYGAPVLLLLALVMIVTKDREKLREPLRFVGLALAAATLIAMTIFVSPKLGPRFYYVSMALLLAGLVGVIDAVLAPRQLAPLVALAVLASGYAAYRTVPLYAKLDRQGAARIAALEAHPRGTVFIADAFAQVDEDWWSLGDDFRDAKKRELVATYFDLAGVVFRAYNPNVPLGVMGARLVPHYKVSPESCLDEYGGFALGSFKGFDLAGLHREMKIAIALLQERIGAAAALHEVELAVELDDPTAKLPRAKTLVGRWTPSHFEGHIGKIVRRSRSRTRDIKLPVELSGKETEVFVYNVGGEAKPIGNGGGGELAYVPWRSGVYWILACRPDECWVIAATRQGG
jgi:hypothetical protein